MGSFGLTIEKLSVTAGPLSEALKLLFTHRKKKVPEIVLIPNPGGSDMSLLSVCKLLTQIIKACEEGGVSRP